MPQNASYLVAYATKNGHSRSVAEAVAGRLQGQGIRVDTAELGRDGDPDPADYSGVVVVAPVYRAKHPRPAVAWLKRHATVLSDRPLALLVVSLTAVGTDAESRAEAQGLADGLGDAGGVRPALAVPVAGALDYARYGFLVRLMLRRIAARKGLTTDTSRNHDFTDWRALDDVAARLAALVDGGATPTA